MDEAGSDQDQQISSLFEDALPTIHATLVSYYRFMPEEAEAFQDTLYVWFNRMVRRLGSRRAPLHELREQLLFVMCKYARAFQIARFRGIEPAHEEFTMALARAPEEVTLELLSRIQTEPTHL